HVLAGEAANVDALDVRAALLAGLDVDGVLHRVVAGEVRGVDHAPLGEDVADAAGHLAADRDAAPAAGEGAVLDDDVLAGHAHPAAVGVASRLHRHAVVVGVEAAVVDVHVRRRLRIAAVRVVQRADDGDAAHGDV